MNRYLPMRAALIFLIAAMMAGRGASAEKQRSGSGPLPIPPKPGRGFSISLGPQLYGTREQPLKDGDIFKFIDGGGVVYLQYGFQAVVHVVFTDKNKNDLTVDVFDMGSDAGARKAFADESICADGWRMISVGAEAKSYHFEPDYFLYFVKRRYLVYCHIGDDGMSAFLNEYANALFKEIL